MIRAALQDRRTSAATSSPRSPKTAMTTTNSISVKPYETSSSIAWCRSLLGRRVGRGLNLESTAVGCSVWRESWPLYARGARAIHNNDNDSQLQGAVLSQKKGRAKGRVLTGTQRPAGGRGSCQAETSPTNGSRHRRPFDDGRASRLRASPGHPPAVRLRQTRTRASGQRLSIPPLARAS